MQCERKRKIENARQKREKGCQHTNQQWDRYNYIILCVRVMCTMYITSLKIAAAEQRFM